MVILGQDKGSKKRKRSKSADESLLDEQETNFKKRKGSKNDHPEKEFETTSPEHKPAKKKKKDRLSYAVDEDSHNSTEIKSKKKDNIKDQHENSSPPKNTKKEKKKSISAVVEDEESSSPKKTKKEKKKKTSVEEQNEEPDSVSETKKEKKKKKKDKSSFGVVNTKLLKSAGGEIKQGPPEQGSRINRAVDYLHLWKEDRKSWKFNKNFQSLLLKAIYNPIIITEDDFETLLLHLEQCKGSAREKLRTDAMALIKEDEDQLAESIDADKLRRARQIIQMLG